MLKQHRNELFKVVQEIGFPLTDIETSIEDDKKSSRKSCFVIKIRNTPLKFWVWTNPANYNQYQCKMSLLCEGYQVSKWSQTVNRVLVGNKLVEEEAILNLADVCDALVIWFRNVVEVVQEENNIPDFWSQAEASKLFASSFHYSQEDTEPFTPDEKEQVLQSLRDFHRLLLENIQTNHEQKEFIAERLEYLAQAVDRLNRYDWKGLAFSIVIGIGINLTVDTETGKIIFYLFDQAFHSAIHLLGQ